MEIPPDRDTAPAVAQHKRERRQCGSIARSDGDERGSTKALVTSGVNAA